MENLGNSDIPLDGRIPVGILLASAQEKIHLQKTIVGRALADLHIVGQELSSEPAEPGTLLVGQVLSPNPTQVFIAEKKTLHDLRQERNQLRNSMGRKRKGELLTATVAKPPLGPAEQKVWIKRTLDSLLRR